MKQNLETIDEYIKSFQPEVQNLLFEIRNIIKSVVPEADEAIKYGMPTFRLHGNLIHFAAYKNHIGFYPAPAAIIAFKDEISIYKNSKGAIQFPLNQKLPLDLIIRITQFRKAQSIAKAILKKAQKQDISSNKITSV